MGRELAVDFLDLGCGGEIEVEKLFSSESEFLEVGAGGDEDVFVIGVVDPASDFGGVGEISAGLVYGGDSGGGGGFGFGEGLLGSGDEVEPELGLGVGVNDLVL